MKCSELHLAHSLLLQLTLECASFSYNNLKSTDFKGSSTTHVYSGFYLEQNYVYIWYHCNAAVSGVGEQAGSNHAVLRKMHGGA